LRKVIPQVVNEDNSKEKYLSVDYGSVTALLVESIKELNDKIEEQEKRIKKLEKNG